MAPTTSIALVGPSVPSLPDFPIGSICVIDVPIGLTAQSPEYLRLVADQDAAFEAAGHYCFTKGPHSPAPARLTHSSPPIRPGREHRPKARR